MIVRNAIIIIIIIIIIHINAINDEIRRRITFENICYYSHPKLLSPSQLSKTQKIITTILAAIYGREKWSPALRVL
jgi:uncharacterized protein (UPF0276 family)